jgi:hypothetical protein
MKYILSLRTASVALLLVFGHAETAPPGPSGDEFFEKEARPILVDCYQSCHSGAMTKAI